MRTTTITGVHVYKYRWLFCKSKEDKSFEILSKIGMQIKLFVGQYLAQLLR